MWLNGAERGAALGSTLMSGTPSFRARVTGAARRRLGGTELASTVAAVRHLADEQRSSSSRIDAVERRLGHLEARADGLQQAVDRLQDTLAAADPAEARAIIGAVRSDVDGLVVRVNSLLAATADQG